MFDLDFLKTCTAGFGRMTDEAQDVLRQMVSLAQKPDGLFPDRSGHGDLYYTLFGLSKRPCTKGLRGVRDFWNLSLISHVSLMQPSQEPLPPVRHSMPHT